jgi:hypothetical protein
VGTIALSIEVPFVFGCQDPHGLCVRQVFFKAQSCHRWLTFQRQFSMSVMPPIATKSRAEESDYRHLRLLRAHSSGIAAAPPSKLVNLRRLIVSAEAQIRAPAMMLLITVSSGWFSELTFAHP